MNDEDVRRRSDIAQHLGRGVRPADHETLLDKAQENDAPDGVLAQLRRLP